MFSRVDLPEPDGPSRTTNSPATELEVNAPQRLYGDLPHLVDFCEPTGRKHPRVGRRHFPRLAGRDIRNGRSHLPGYQARCVPALASREPSFRAVQPRRPRSEECWGTNTEAEDPAPARIIPHPRACDDRPRCLGYTTWAINRSPFRQRTRLTSAADLASRGMAPTSSAHGQYGTFRRAHDLLRR